MASKDQDRYQERLLEVLENLGRLVERLHTRLDAVEQEVKRAHEDTTSYSHPHAMRARIYAVLREHPTGLDRKAIERAVGTKKNLSDTLVGLVRHKRLVRPRPGIYAISPDLDVTSETGHK
jgi:hypothetical protein